LEPFVATVVATGETDRTEPVPPDAKPFKLWQRDFWDTQMRSRAHYEEKLSYVRMNPVRKELVKTPEEWPYQGVIHEIRWM
jgi:REP element-mobilizing transposase RayT